MPLARFRPVAEKKEIIATYVHPSQLLAISVLEHLSLSKLLYDHYEMSTLWLKYLSLLSTLTLILQISPAYPCVGHRFLSSYTKEPRQTWTSRALGRHAFRRYLEAMESNKEDWILPFAACAINDYWKLHYHHILHAEPWGESPCLSRQRKVLRPQMIHDCSPCTKTRHRRSSFPQSSGSPERNLNSTSSMLNIYKP